MLLDEIRELRLGVSHLLGGDWWNDGRQNWCAYCGIPMRKKIGTGTTIPPTKATRDHVIPKAHKGGSVTIPACRQCNSAKGSMSLPEFLESPRFAEIRAHKHRNRWPLHALWAVDALAALKHAEALLAASAVPMNSKRGVAGSRADHI